MTTLIFILGVIFSIMALSSGDWRGAIAIWVVAGLILFVWQTVMQAGKKITGSFPQEHYHLTQNRYDLTESDDPTRPNENVPAIIEIGKHYRKKS